VHDAVRQPHPHEAVNHVAHQRVVARLEVHVRVPVETPVGRDGNNHLLNPLWNVERERVFVGTQP
jgi:hypothetical protein